MYAKCMPCYPQSQKPLFLFAFFPVEDVSLSQSLVPYKGFVQIIIDGRKMNVCWQRSYSYYRYIVCRYLGYGSAYSYVNMSAPMDLKHSTFSGTMNCNGNDKYLSQCSIAASTGESCFGLSYIECKYRWRGQHNNAVYLYHFKPVVHFSRIVSKRSVFYCVPVISSA